jgi:uncharacterized protein
MTLSKQAVIDTLSERKNQLQTLHVSRLGLFGSVVRDEARQDSDVDLIVEFEAGHKSFDNFMDVVELLEDALQRRVELVTAEALSPYIRPHILQEVEYVFVAA